MAKLSLPGVTLCAATSVNVAATVAALRTSMAQIDFAECLLLTDATGVPDSEGIRIVPIEPMRSGRDYSRLIISQLANHVRTGHCLIVQWDGFVLDTAQWDARFLDFDYIGALWPQFADNHRVGNGGFSLRSHKLLAACQDQAFKFGHPEDIAIGRTNRAMLEARHGLRFADEAVAERFSFERKVPVARTFGFHGVFNLIATQGVEAFWKIYCSLDDPRTAFVDFRAIWNGLGSGRVKFWRRARLTRDCLRNLLRG